MPNRTTPEFWNENVILNSLTRDAELLFRKLQGLICDDHRFPLIPSPQEPDNIKSRLYYLRRGVRITDVARWLDELQRAGAILVRPSDRGWYGEIVESLRYRAEDFSKGAPRYGPRSQKPPEEQQRQLPLPPMGLVSPAPKSPVRSKPYEYEYDNDHESARIRAEVSRSLSRKKDSDRFAASPDDEDDDVWRDLCRALPARELLGHGAAWKKRRATSRRALAEAVQELLSLTPDQAAKIVNKSAWLVAKYHELGGQSVAA